MHDPRNSTALRQLADLGHEPEPRRWRWAVARPDPEGRLRLPAEVRRALGVRAGRRTEVRGLCHRVALLVGTVGVGAPLVVDSRGRLTLPMWLRRGTVRFLADRHRRRHTAGGDRPGQRARRARRPVGGTVAMTDRHLRARVLLEEARALGFDLVDLIAADTTRAAIMPTVGTCLDAIALTLTAATAATYRPYWRLATARLGDRRLVEVTVEDLAMVVADAAGRARRARPGSPGRASRESCVAALRALLGRAAAAGLVTVNPAAALTKPRRVRSRRRALDDELADLIDAVRTTSPRPRPRPQPVDRVAA